MPTKRHPSSPARSGLFPVSVLAATIAATLTLPAVAAQTTAAADADTITVVGGGNGGASQESAWGPGKIHEHARIYRLRSVAGSQILNFMS